jgi:hypothetical protein
MMAIAKENILCIRNLCLSGRATIRNKSGIPLFKNYSRCGRNEYSARSYRSEPFTAPVIAVSVLLTNATHNLKPVNIPEIIAIAGQAEPKMTLFKAQ